MKEMTVKQMASLGGHARAAKLSKQRRSAIARQAINTRWRREKRKPKSLRIKPNSNKQQDE